MASSGLPPGSPPSSVAAGGAGIASGDVVVLRFPFSDLSGIKSRPVVLLADAGMGDFVACQVTSKATVDQRAVQLTSVDFAVGSLHVTSFARPGKLFTANGGIVRSVVGRLVPGSLERIRREVIDLIRHGI